MADDPSPIVNDSQNISQIIGSPRFNWESISFPEITKKNEERKDTQTGLEVLREEMDKAFKNSAVGGDNNSLLQTKIEFDSDRIGSNEFMRFNEFFVDFDYALPPTEEVQTLRRLE